MTVTYSLSVSNAGFFGFSKLLLRWRGSVYKLLYKEMIIVYLLYYILGCVYRYVLNSYQQELFDSISEHCRIYINRVSLSLILGVYLSVVIYRWWQQFQAIQYPDKLAMLISGYINGHDERSFMIRRTLARYLNLMFVLTLQAISVAVKKRFPTVDHLIESGLMTIEEKVAYEEIKLNVSKWWIPAQWFTSLACRAYREGRITSYHNLLSLSEELQVLRGKCGTLFDYDLISIPLIYTQLVTIVIYIYFVGALMGRQNLNRTKNVYGNEIDFYSPVFVMLEFFFYMGLLKVAEQLINPFGEDDDDFEANSIIDRHFQMTLAIVDGMHGKIPTLTKDAFWDEPVPQLPYTRLTAKVHCKPHQGSTVNIHISPEECEFIPLETIKEVNGKDEKLNQSLNISPIKLQSTFQPHPQIFSPERKLSNEMPDMQVEFDSANLYSKITNATDEPNGGSDSMIRNDVSLSSLLDAIAQTSPNSVCEENGDPELQICVSSIFSVKEEAITECQRDLGCCLIDTSTDANVKDSTPSLIPTINTLSTSRSFEIIPKTQSENIDSKQILLPLENNSDFQLERSSYERNSLQDSETYLNNIGQSDV